MMEDGLCPCLHVRAVGNWDVCGMKQIVIHSSRSHDDDECPEVADYIITSITHKPKRSGLINKFNDLDLCSTSTHKFASSQDKPLSILASAT